MTVEPKAYFSGIEKKLIEIINHSKTSIQIAMAWFTNDDIKDCLINKKRSDAQIDILIVVDDNKINDTYFANYELKFREVGIKVSKKVSRRFLHNKFMVIDGYITVTGSYNYSKKANNNLENIVVIHNADLSLFYSRVFKVITDQSYIDENIQLLYENLDFAQELLSTYYSFTKTEYEKYKDRIVLGDCFSHDNGFFDEVTYFPGLIFNPKVVLSEYKKSEFSEFDLPINKNIIKAWVASRNSNVIIDSYRGDEENYHIIGDRIDENIKEVESLFKRKLERTYNYSELEGLIKSNIDIILEDDLWTNNFEPFINRKHVQGLFEQFKLIERKNWC